MCAKNTSKKPILRIMFEITAGIFCFGLVAFYSNVMVAVGVVAMIELNNYMLQGK